ncbi:MAG: urease accessory protein UreE [Clostridia bacterium]|nr:urease accessory protein UreE [Clostridia bacterium]NCC41987.1 urease accessory protein UreE [Clostridia bacterium]
MIANKVIGNIKDLESAAVTGKNLKMDPVSLEWYEREKKLLSKTTSDGIEMGIRVEVLLEDGDILYQDDERIIFIQIQPTKLICASVHSMQEMGRLCFELGNRHLSLAIHEDSVWVPYDEPTFLYLKKLGFEVEQREEKFLDYTVCHAHGHHHE